MKSLSFLHKMMARAVALEGMDNIKLREMSGYSEVHVSRIMNDKLFIEEVKRLAEKVEEHELKKKKESLSVLYDNLTALMTEQVNIGLKGEADSVRSQAIDRLMSYVFKKKDMESDVGKRVEYIAVQLSEDIGELEADPDINPSANENIIEFKEAVNDDVQ